MEKAIEDKNSSEEILQAEKKSIKLADFEIERVKEITLGTENVVSREVIEMALDDIVETLQNGHPLNRITIDESQNISGYIACEDFEEKVAYIKYIAAENNGDVNLFSEVSKLLQNAEEEGYEKINFHGWNKDLNEVLKKRFDFKHLRTDTAMGHNIDFLEREIGENKQEVLEKQKEVFKQKNLLRIKNLYIKTIEKSIDLQPNIESLVSESFRSIDSKISSQLDSYSETEQEILKLKLARHFQNNKNLDENVLVDAILETPKFIQKDKGSLSRLFEIHEQKTIMRIAEMKKARAEIGDNESFNPFESLSQSKSGEYYIARLLNMPHLEEESEYMNHCVGTSDSYISKIKRGKIDILSIRNTPTINQETNKLENDSPLITIEYNRKTGLIEQMKKNNDEYLSSDDPYYADTLELLGNIHQHEIDPTRNYPISGINESETENIHVPEKHILLNTGLVALEDYDPDSMSESFIIKCESPEISAETSEEEFAIYAKIPGIKIRIDSLEIAKKFLDGNVSEIKGDLHLSSLDSAEGLVLPKEIGGYLDLRNLRSAEGLVLPNEIGGSLSLYSLRSAEGLVLPNEIGGNLDLRSLSSAEGLVLPSEFGGDLSLSSLSSAEGLVLPNEIGGNLSLYSLSSAEGLVLPNEIGGNLSLSSLSSAEGLVLPSEFGGDLSLSSLSSAEGLVLPNKIGGNLSLYSLSSAEGLVLPNEIGGNLDLSGLSSAEDLVLPNEIGGRLDLTSLSSTDKEMLREKYPQHADKI